MQAGIQFRLQKLVDRAVARKARHAGKLGGNDANSYMSFTGPGHVGLVTRMKVAFIDDGKALGRESVSELPLNAGLQCRFHIPASTSLTKKRLPQSL
jgi:hypothetical protein